MVLLEKSKKKALHQGGQIDRDGVYGKENRVHHLHTQRFTIDQLLREPDVALPTITSRFT
ncbi:hypothetical protein AU507_12790 [Lonsdalea populi]|nr:hypothetical protein AU507_12790 [Lonsdalea populi]